MHPHVVSYNKRCLTKIKVHLKFVSNDCEKQSSCLTKHKSQNFDDNHKNQNFMKQQW
jgi:hypothetical protein